jgi:hypothetical protein
MSCSIHHTDIVEVESDDLVLGSLLVDAGRGAVLLLVELVTDGILGGRGTSANTGVAVLGNVLVGLLGSGRDGT